MFRQFSLLVAVLAFGLIYLLESEATAHIVDLSVCGSECGPTDRPSDAYCSAENSAPEVLFPGTPKTAFAKVCMQNCDENCPENGPADDPATTAQLCLTISQTEGAEIGSEITAKIGGGTVPAEIGATLSSALSAQSTFECTGCQTVGLGVNNSCLWAKKYLQQQIKQGCGYKVDTQVNICDPQPGGNVCYGCWSDTSTIVGDVCVGEWSQGTLESGTCDPDSPCPVNPPGS